MRSVEVPPPPCWGAYASRLRPRLGAPFMHPELYCFAPFLLLWLWLLGDFALSEPLHFLIPLDFPFSPSCGPSPLLFYLLFLYSPLCFLPKIPKHQHRLLPGKLAFACSLQLAACLVLVYIVGTKKRRRRHSPQPAASVAGV